MSGRWAVWSLVYATTAATAAPSDAGMQPGASSPVAVPVGNAPVDMGDQAVGAEIGIATGSHITPGGLRLAGHYLYRLSTDDWFEGIAGFTFGADDAQCFRDRNNAFVCDHGVANGSSIDVAASVRHFIATTRNGFWPFVRGGVGIGVVRFSGDDVTGLAIPFLVGAGLRVSVTSTLALVGEAQLRFGFGAFDHGLGLEPQLGAGFTVGAEFRL